MWSDQRQHRGEPQKVNDLLLQIKLIIPFEYEPRTTHIPLIRSYEHG